MSKENFHSQFREMLAVFSADAHSYLVHFEETKLNSLATERPIQLDESLMVNASVERGEDGYAFYKITAGAIAAITDVSYSMAATKGFMEEIPITGRVFDTSRARASIDFANYSYLLGDGQPLPLIPQRMIFDDPRRKALGELIRNLALRFLLMHEQAHFVGGHLHYLHGIEKTFLYEEMLSDKIINISHFDRRTLEIDADGSAYVGLLEAYGSTFQKNLLNDFTEEFGSLIGWTRLVSVSSVMVMLLLSIIDGLIPENGRRNHPTSQARMLNILLAMKNHTINDSSVLEKGQSNLQFVSLFGDIQLVSKFVYVNSPSYEAFAAWHQPEQRLKNGTCIELLELMNSLGRIRERSISSF